MLTVARTLLPALAVATTLAVGETGARAESLAVFPAGGESLPAIRYAAMDRATCESELGRRGIAFDPVATGARGVLAPVRLHGPVNGVEFKTELPDKQRATSPFEVFDCRLVLALHDFAGILKAHGVDEVSMFSAWRPPSKNWPEGRIADRHPGALALDARRFHKASGEWLVVENDYHGRIGNRTCGEGAMAPSPETSEARELRSIVCEAADAHIFNGILTPNYNAAHFNHFHLEVKANVRWFLVR